MTIETQKAIECSTTTGLRYKTMQRSGTEMGLNVSFVQKMLILNGAIFCHHARASACITSVASEISCVFSENE